MLLSRSNHLFLVTIARIFYWKKNQENMTRN